MRDASEIDRLNDILSDASNLTAALQFVLWDLCQEQFPPGSSAALRRDALIGIGDALERALERWALYGATRGGSGNAL